MVTALFLLVLLAVLGWAGVTGHGAVDTRDPEFTVTPRRRPTNV